MVRAADVVRPELLPGHVWKPADNELLAANFPPRQIVTGFVLTNGFQFFHRVRIPADTPITNLVLFCTTAGAGLTYARAGVYESDGTQVGLSTDQSTAWQSVGTKTVPLATPVPAKQSARWVWVGLCAVGTTQPGFGSAHASTFAVASIGIGAQPLNNGYRAGSVLESPATMSFTSYAEAWVGIK
jgi:hypothetical protein